MKQQDTTDEKSDLFSSSSHKRCIEHMAVCNDLNDVAKEVKEKISYKVFFSLFGIYGALILAVFGWLVLTTRDIKMIVDESGKEGFIQRAVLEQSINGVKMDVREMQFILRQFTNEDSDEAIENFGGQKKSK